MSSEEIKEGNERKESKDGVNGENMESSEGREGNKRKENKDSGSELVMNPVIEAIGKRRSIRDYEAKPVPRDVLNTIIRAGNQAPFMAEKGSQPWRFVVVEDPGLRQKLVETTIPIWKKFIENLKQTEPEMFGAVMKLYDTMDEPKDLVYYSAPAVVFVISTNEHITCCALACENIMIAATSLGLGSCYSGFGAMVTGNEDVKKALELKEDERIFGCILLGYPKDKSSARVANALASLAPKKKEPIIKWI